MPGPRQRADDLQASPGAARSRSSPRRSPSKSPSSEPRDGLNGEQSKTVPHHRTGQNAVLSAPRGHGVSREMNGYDRRVGNAEAGRRARDVVRRASPDLVSRAADLVTPGAAGVVRARIA